MKFVRPDKASDLIDRFLVSNELIRRFDVDAERTMADERRTAYRESYAFRFTASDH